MNEAELRKHIDDYAAGSISEAAHAALQETLKSDAQARAVFRETMDMEQGLRTWAAEESLPTAPRAESRRVRAFAPWIAAASVVAAVVMGAVLGGFQWRGEPRREPIAAENPIIEPPLGTLSSSEDCVWEFPEDAADSGRFTGGRFTTGRLRLASGTARLRFDSGTDVMLQGPGEVEVLSADSARLLAGNVVVHVTELSDGFTLKTPDALILDEGTEYAVSLDDEATEVHVFDGSVFWEPLAKTDEGKVERIEAGEARRYSRSRPGHGARIPLGMRKFVRRLEAAVQEKAGGGLLAYDGFENLAGRIRRGRSGFGWIGGWKSSFRGRGPVGSIVDAPDDTPFGIARQGRRLFQLSDGHAITRDLETPLLLDPGEVTYLSFLARRRAGAPGAGRYLRVSLRDEGQRARRGARRELAVGVTSDGFPFVKTDGRIVQSAPPIEEETTYLFVAKLVVSRDRVAEVSLRVYRPGESVDPQEPGTWTVVGRPGRCESAVSRIRLAVGDAAVWEIDELKIGATWRSVTGVH